MKVWTKLSPDEIRSLAHELGIKIHGDYGLSGGISKDGRAWNFRLALGDEKREKNRKYQRTSTSYYGNGRRVAAVCWHGHRDFMRAILARDPEARIKTAYADYRGAQDFEDSFGNTGYKNVGSMMNPVFAKDACTCSHDEWDVDASINGTYAVRIPQSMIRECPFVILNPEHYRADGSCKCDDAAERTFMRLEWGYSDEDFANIPLRQET